MFVDATYYCRQIYFFHNLVLKISNLGPIFKCDTILETFGTTRKATAHAHSSGEKSINLPWPNVKRLNNKK